MPFLRRVRGLFGVSVGFAAIFITVNVGIAIIDRVLSKGPAVPLTTFLTGVGVGAIRWGAIGAAIGSIFALLIMLTQRRRKIESLSPWRLSGWGFLAGATVPLAITTVLLLTKSASLEVIMPGIAFAGMCGVLGSVLAVAGVRIAQRTSKQLAEPEIAAIPTRTK